MDRNKVKRRLETALTSAALQWERLARPRAGVATPRHVLMLHFPVAVGIAVNQIPLFEALKQVRPAVSLTVAGAGPGFALLRHCPFVDRLVEIPNPAVNLRASVKALQRALGLDAQTVDCVLFGTFDRQRANVRLAWLTLKVWRGGFAEYPRTVQRPLEHDSSLSVIGNNLRVAGLLGWHGPLLAPRVFFAADDLAAAQEVIGSSGVPVLTVISQASEPEACWLEDRLAEVLQYAQKKLGFRVLLDGGPGQEPALSRISKAAGTGTALAGRTSLTSAAAVYSLSDLVLAVNTGPMHIARAVKVPLLTLIPAWASAEDWHPLQNANERLLQKPRRTLDDTNRNLADFSAAEVIDALSSMAAKYPPTEEARRERVRACLRDPS